MTRLRFLSLILLAVIIIVFSAVMLHDAFHPPASPAGPTEPGLSKPVVTEPEKAAPFKPTVGLYTGRGSWDPDLVAMRNFLAGHDLDWVEIAQGALGSTDLGERCDLLVLVGGFSSEYLHYIENHANIRSFVENGGGFVGFCAGAYYASSTMVWRGEPLDYPLKLFPGEAAGPLNIGWGSLAAVDLNRDLPFNRDFGETMEMWYFDGPCFTGLEGSGADVLARYRANGEAAVIAFDMGKGRVLLSGPHPELGYSPAEERVETEGGGGAQWPWLYAALQWLIRDR